MSEKPLSKKELRQPDIVQQSLYAFVDKAYRQRNQFIAAGVVLALVVLGGWGWVQYTESVRVEQSNLFYAAEKILTDLTLSEEESLRRGSAALEHVAKELTDGLLAAVVRLKLGNILMQQGNYGEAGKNFLQAGKLASESPYLRDISKLNMAKVYAAQKNWGEAQNL